MLHTDPCLLCLQNEAVRAAALELSCYYSLRSAPPSPPAVETVHARPPPADMATNDAFSSLLDSTDVVGGLDALDELFPDASVLIDSLEVFLAGPTGMDAGMLDTATADPAQQDVLDATVVW